MTVRFCKNCFTPNTRPRIVFTKDICNACLNSKEKKKLIGSKEKESFVK
jgi:hypothetical protein